MDILEIIHTRARAKYAKIVLPEGDEERTVQAAAIITQEKIAQVTLLGDNEKINKVARTYGADISNVKIVDPLKSELAEKYAQELYEKRKSKGLSFEDARELVKNPLYFGVMMVDCDEANGMVAGARNTTSNVLRPALQVLGTQKGIRTVSGGFIVVVPNCEFGSDGIFFFTDCGVTPNPTAEQLAEIAYLGAREAEVLLGLNPRVAMLSFSTMGSAKDDTIDVILEGLKIAKERYPDMLIDGELQLDAALVPDVAESKAPDSKIAGRANVLVFPNLHAGNVGYKLVQRLAKAEAIGPILQGIAKPVNDLSRGCNVNDIITTVAVTALQSGRE